MMEYAPGTPRICRRTDAGLFEPHLPRPTGRPEIVADDDKLGHLHFWPARPGSFGKIEHISWKESDEGGGAWRNINEAPQVCDLVTAMKGIGYEDLVESPGIRTFEKVYDTHNIAREVLFPHSALFVAHARRISDGFRIAMPHFKVHDGAMCSDDMLLRSLADNPLTLPLSSQGLHAQYDVLARGLVWALTPASIFRAVGTRVQQYLKDGFSSVSETPAGLVDAIDEQMGALGMHVAIAELIETEAQRNGSGVSDRRDIIEGFSRVIETTNDQAEDWFIDDMLKHWDRLRDAFAQRSDLILKPFFD